MTEVTINVAVDEAEADEALSGLPDGPHVEIAFDALNDTIENVTGTESLTQAQMYMEPILVANGLISQADRVNGMEGFFSAIGDGAKKTWEYIKKMFKSIWEFFFKKEAPALAKEAKKETDDAKATVDLTNLDSAKASMSKALVYVADGTELGELRDHLKEANTKSAVEAVGAKIARKNERARKSLSLKVGQLIETIKAGLALSTQVSEDAKKHSVPEYTTFAADMASDDTTAKALQASLEKVRDLEDFGLARSFLTQLVGYVGVIEKEISKISGEESKIKTSIGHIEQIMGKMGEGDGKAEAQKQLAGLRALMASAAKHSTIVKRTLEEVKAVDKALPRVFGL